MSSVATADATHVATSTAPASIPTAPSTAGCTKTMYAIVMNVVTPASTSVRTDVRRAVRWKKRSSTSLQELRKLVFDGLTPDFVALGDWMEIVGPERVRQEDA